MSASVENTTKACRVRILSILVATALILLGSSCDRPPTVPRNVILISLDTVGAKHLGSYGHPGPISPTLDAFAADGVRFANAIAAAPWTLPSHASMLTGLYPSRHGVRILDHKLGADVPSLATILGSRGFDTAAIVNCIFLADTFGLAHGFDSYQYVPTDHSRAGAAAQVTDRVIDWLEGRREKQVFLFIHYFDVHSDYRSELRYEKMFDVEPGRVDRNTLSLARIVRREVAFGPSDAEQLERLYDAGIRQLDDEIARLMNWLEDRGWLSDSFVVVTADHGEEFLEHGGILHGASHYREMLRVPLIMRGPSLPRGVTIEAPVSLVDILPTALSQLEIPLTHETSGIDLRRSWEAPDEPIVNRWIFAEGGRGFLVDIVRSVRNNRYKLIVDLSIGHRELYDLVDDPGETHDIIDAQPAIAEELSQALDQFMGTEREPQPAQLSPENEEQLRRLGYL